MIAAPAISRQVEVRVGTVFLWAGRPLKVASVHGDDPAAPVIVEEMADGFAWLEGQFALWSLASVVGAIHRPSGPGLT